MRSDDLLIRHNAEMQKVCCVTEEIVCKYSINCANNFMFLNQLKIPLI